MTLASSDHPAKFGFWQKAALSLCYGRNPQPIKSATARPRASINGLRASLLSLLYIDNDVLRPFGPDRIEGKTLRFEGAAGAIPFGRAQ